MSSENQKCIRCAFRGPKNDPKFLAKNGKTYTKTCISCRDKKLEYTNMDIGDFKKCTDCPLILNKDDPTFIGKDGKVTKKCSECREKCRKRDNEYRENKYEENPDEYNKHNAEVHREWRKRKKLEKN